MKKIKVTIHPNKNAPNLFKNKWLEKLTWSDPFLIFGMYAVIGFLMVYYAKTSFDFSYLKIVSVFGLGFISWTLAEYLLHRFLYHRISDSGYDKGFQYLFHGVHHSYPNDTHKTTLPPVPSLLFAIGFFLFFWFIMGRVTWVFTPGFLMGYSFYVMIHNMVHTMKPPVIYNFWWRHHSIHHFQQHDKAFGVSTPIWDIIFGTMPIKNRKTVEILIPTKDSN